MPFDSDQESGLFCQFFNLKRTASTVLGFITLLLQFTQDFQQWISEIMGFPAPLGCVSTVLFSYVLLDFLVRQLVHRDKNLIYGGSPRLHFEKHSVRRRLLWCFTIATPLLAIGACWLFCDHLYRLPGQESSIRIFIDKFDTHGAPDIAWEQQIKTEMKRELAGILPDATLYFLPTAPKGIESQQERLDWACNSGATLVIYGVREQDKIWPNVRICSRNVPAPEFEDFEIQVSAQDVTEAQLRSGNYRMFSPDQAIHLCFIDSLAIPRVNYLALLSLGLIMLHDDVPGISVEQRYASAHSLFKRAVSGAKGISGCDLDYCQALTLSGLTASRMITRETDYVDAFLLLAEANNSLSEVTRLRPTDWYAQFNFAYILSAQAQFFNDLGASSFWRRSFERYAEAARLKPDVSAVHNNWGNALSSYANLLPSDSAVTYFEQSLEQYSRATQLWPDTAYTYCNWAIALCNYARKLGATRGGVYFIEGFEKYAKAAELGHTGASTYYNWGNALYDYAGWLDNDSAIDFYKQSFDKYERAARISPTRDDAYYNWGLSLTNCARRCADQIADQYFSESFEKFAEAVRLKPDKYEAYTNWGSALFYFAQTQPLEISLEYYRRSFEKFASAISLKSDFCVAYYNWSISLKHYSAVVCEGRVDPVLAALSSQIGLATEAGDSRACCNLMGIMLDSVAVVEPGVAPLLNRLPCDGT